jgi:hypothetical protein
MLKTYKYKLNNNFLDGEMCKVEGYLIEKYKWTNLHVRVLKLEQYIRTKSNPKGILDYIESDPGTSEVFFSSEENLKFKLDRFYSRDYLLTLDRKEINNIAKGLEIDVLNRKKEFVIDLICKKEFAMGLDPNIKIEE